jgi:outer membrane protein assembly factor BamB
MRVPGAGLLVLLTSCAGAYDWPMLGRDASRNAVSPERNPPIDWSTRAGDLRNVAWTARIGDSSFGSPIVSDGLVWVGTNNEVPRDPVCKVDASVLMCFRASDGKFLWQHASPRKAEMDSHGDWGRLPLRSTPLVEGDRLWFVDNCWDVICLDIGPLKRGECVPVERWRINLIQTADVWPQVHGMGYGLPLSFGPSLDGRLYLATGNGCAFKTGKPARPQAPAVVCLDAHTGEILGRERSGISARTYWANWSSPVLARIGDRVLLLFGGGDGFLYAFDPVPSSEDGTLRELWRVDCRREGADVGITAAPVVADGRVFVALGHEADAGGDGAITCIDLASARRVWVNREFAQTCSSPVFHDGRLIAPYANGQVFCLDASTGRPIWEHDMLSMITTSPMMADGRVYFTNSDDEVVILDVRNTDRKPPALKRELSGCSLTSPIYSHGTLYLVGRRHLYAIREGDPGPPAPQSPATKRGRDPGARYLPTPKSIVESMLRSAGVKASDTVVDLGSGDGRILISAASRYKARGIGVELDPELVQLSREAVRAAGLADRVRIIHEDLLKAKFQEATVVTLYVGERLNRLLIPKLEALQAGTRIVCHRFPLPGMKADRITKVVSKEEGLEHELYFYTTPLKPED